MANERKSQIVKAAAKRFARHGLNKTTLDEVARDIRIGKATIYHYFTSKDELFIETLRWEIENFLEQIKVIFDNDNKKTEEKLSDLISLKENVQTNFKLIYETLQNYFVERALEKEIEEINYLLTKEEEIIKKSISRAYKEKITSISPAVPYFIVIASWAILFEIKLIELNRADKNIATKELIRKVLESALP